MVLNPDSQELKPLGHCSKMLHVLNCLSPFIIIVSMGQVKGMTLEGLMGKKMILETIIGVTPTKFYIETLIKNMMTVSTLAEPQYQEQVEIFQTYLLPNHLR